MDHKNAKLAAGVIIEKEDQILLVYEKQQWGLPKGKREVGESLAETAIREAKEETGLDVELGEVAFITEFQKENRGYFLQVFYRATIVGGSIQAVDPHGEIEAVSYIDKNDIRGKMKYRPRLEPLEHWLKYREMSYHYFDLDIEASFV